MTEVRAARFEERTSEEPMALSMPSSAGNSEHQFAASSSAARVVAALLRQTKRGFGFTKNSATTNAVQ